VVTTTPVLGKSSEIIHYRTDPAKYDLKLGRPETYIYIYCIVFLL